ncbi:MAG TPA: diguanylate cyclase, partial [Burkholderiaceae bacterium]|nr:diguanylate cyclase [Burkholderiaceae bacterium]
YNDHYGHQAGDQCLQSVATTLEENCTRSHDLLARYGGEEFACILPDTPLEGAEQKARQLEQVVRALQIPHAKSDVTNVVTISLGVAVTIPAMEENFVDLISCADSQLYFAKEAGRGQMRSHQMIRK